MLRRLLACLCLLLPAPLLAQWQVAATPHFRLYGELPASDLTARVRVLEDFHALLVRATGRTLPEGAPPLDVFLVERLADATPWQQMPSDVAGFYRADSGRISAVALAGGSGGPVGLSSQQLLLHEYAHHFLLGSGRFAYPAWYVEGFAEYFSTARFDATGADYGLAAPARTSALQSGSWLPLDRLLARDPRIARGESARMFYAQSWLLTHFLFRTPGYRDRLTTYLKATAAGDDPVAAFRRDIDPDLAGFERKLRRHAGLAASPIRFEHAETAGPVTLATFPASADALLLRKVALEHGGSQQDGARVLADVRGLAAQFPDDAFAQRTLALAELRHGRSDEAARQIDRLLVSDPRDAELLRWRAQAARAARTADASDLARRYLVRAADADPGDWRTLHAYARLYRRTSEPLPAEVLPILLRAYALAPQVTEVVLDTALALANAGRLPEAVAVLEPLAWAPHGGPASELAQRMLARAKAGDQAGLLAEVGDARRQQVLLQSARVSQPAHQLR